MLKLEILGMSRRGQSAYAIIKQETGLKGSKQKSHQLADILYPPHDVEMERAPWVRRIKKKAFLAKKFTCTCIKWQRNVSHGQQTLVPHINNPNVMVTRREKPKNRKNS